MFFSYLLILIYISLIFAQTCKNDQNENIDWFIIYKIPKIENDSENILKEGYGYVYLDVNSNDWQYNARSIQEKDNALAYTMQQLYEANLDENFMFLSYNDKSPNGEEHFDMGHTKGVLMSSKTNGLWLIHSLPQFPIPVNQQPKVQDFRDNDVNKNKHVANDFVPNYTNGEYVYPPNGAWNGQTFFCISINSSQLLNISQLIYYDTPFIHDLHVPDDFKIGNNYLTWLSERSDDPVNKTTPWYVTNTFESLRSKTLFRGFAKYRKFDADIYSEIVAPFYNCDLLSETWQTDHKHVMNSSCKQQKPHVENIRAITFLPQSYEDELLFIKNVDTRKHSSFPPRIHFSELNDHSKWAITNAHYRKYRSEPNTDDPNVICLGDLNREETQKRRPGGLVCFSHPGVWKSFREIVADIEACPLLRNDAIY